jgi:hypothetical protein
MSGLEVEEVASGGHRDGEATATKQGRCDGSSVDTSWRHPPSPNQLPPSLIKAPLLLIRAPPRGKDEARNGARSARQGEASAGSCRRARAGPSVPAPSPTPYAVSHPAQFGLPMSGP